MKEFKIEPSVFITPEDGSKPKSDHIANAIRVLKFPAGNQTLIQNNGGMQQDAVTLTPVQLLELFRTSDLEITHLKNVYLAEIAMSVTETIALLNARIASSKIEKLSMYLRRQAKEFLDIPENAKQVFYTSEHALFLESAKGIYKLTKNLLEHPDATTDEGLLAIYESTEKSATNLFSVEGLNPFYSTHLSKVSNRMQMHTSKLDSE